MKEVVSCGLRMKDGVMNLGYLVYIAVSDELYNWIHVEAVGTINLGNKTVQ